MDFKRVAEGKNYQIIREHILQTSQGVTSFYESAKVRDLNTGEEDYINEDVVDLFFSLYDDYAIGEMKRKSVWNLAQEEDKVEKW